MDKFFSKKNFKKCLIKSNLLIEEEFETDKLTRAAFKVFTDR